jgi:hypothetical protein
MGMGHQYLSEAGSSGGSSRLEAGSIGDGSNKKTGLTPADYFYRIATLVAVAFLIATVF